jgi:hypothetical protein
VVLISSLHTLTVTFYYIHPITTTVTALSTVNPTVCIPIQLVSSTRPFPLSSVYPHLFFIYIYRYVYILYDRCHLSSLAEYRIYQSCDVTEVRAHGDNPTVLLGHFEHRCSCDLRASFMRRLFFT